jgi:hypothetical protein
MAEVKVLIRLLLAIRQTILFAVSQLISFKIVQCRKQNIAAILFAVSTV